MVPKDCGLKYFFLLLRPKKHRDLANDNRVHPLLDRTPQKHQETEGKKSRTGSTFKTEVETTKL
jgi:hypothetical protein